MAGLFKSSVNFKSGHKTTRLKIQYFAILVLVSAFSLPILAAERVSAYSGLGAGTELNPYHILNCDQLQEMQDDLSAHYALYADINCSPSESWNDGAGFDPVGDCWGPGFAGSLNG